MTITDPARLALARAIQAYMLSRLPVDLPDDSVYSAATWNATTLACLAEVDRLLAALMPTAKTTNAGKPTGPGAETP